MDKLIFHKSQKKKKKPSASVPVKRKLKLSAPDYAAISGESDSTE